MNRTPKLIFFLFLHLLRNRIDVSSSTDVLSTVDSLDPGYYAVLWQQPCHLL